MENIKDFWQKRWLTNKTGWDIGYAAPPIASYIDTIKNKDIKILIPGAGNAYEAEYLYNHGFANVYVMDIAAQPLENLSSRVPGFPKEHLLNEDFFAHTGQYDLVFEQTFFVAIDPDLRTGYIQKMHELLKPGGILAGLLIFDKEPSPGGPPFIDTFEGYRKYFYNDLFKVKRFETAENSIKPRAGREIFFELIKI
jgi:hypothetical protein